MIVRNKKGQFSKGNKSGKMFTRETSLGNQFAKGNKPNKTTFVKGQYVRDKHMNWKGGIQIMKKDCAYINLESNKRVRRPLYIYESVYGKLPKGYVIVHKDGNRYNDEINNLEAITRAELLQRNKNH